MRYYPETDSDKEDLAELNAEDWMVEQLKLNPEYLGWGIHEDYMMDKNGQWSSPVEVETWDAFEWNLDELNEMVNFYFHIEREAKPCEACGQTGLNPASRIIEDDFYGFERPEARWCDKITQDEVEALQEANRLRAWNEKTCQWEKVEGLTAEEINLANTRGVNGFGNYSHDAINRWILVETRAKRLGVWGYCEECNGNGYIFTEEKTRLHITLWVIHPRKGCSRGVEIKEIREEQLPEVYAYLREAAMRNAERFAKIPK